jgi:hypothetical protein
MSAFLVQKILRRVSRAADNRDHHGGANRSRRCKPSSDYALRLPV